MHQVPEDRLVADRDHRLRDVLRIIANSGTETSAEQNCFHGLTLCLTIICGVGLPEAYGRWKVSLLLGADAGGNR
jgi:hypothetical protein